MAAVFLRAFFGKDKKGDGRHLRSRGLYRAFKCFCIFGKLRIDRTDSYLYGPAALYAGDKTGNSQCSKHIRPVCSHSDFATKIPKNGKIDMYGIFDFTHPHFKQKYLIDKSII